MLSVGRRYDRGSSVYLADNRVGKCYDCGCKVQYRPYAPHHARKVCFECAQPLIADGAEVVTTPKMAADARNYFRKKLQ
jgi:hypothetical protein